MNQNDIRESIKYFKHAIVVTDEILSDCSAKLQEELTEQKEYFEVAISALEKQIAKKCETDEDNNFYNCPCCKEDLMGCYGENDRNPDCCLWCGQKLLWEESE